MKNDEFDTVSTKERGRIAFWAGRAIFSNPHLDKEAGEWREGWLESQADFRTRGGTETTPTELARLRPAHIQTRERWKRLSRHGMASRSLAKRRAGEGWR